MKIIEFISTGNEIMSGLTIDTNFSWTAKKFIDHGLMIKHHCSIGDYKDDITSALKNASRRSDFVIVTGGLGPTDDDLTASVASSFFNAPLVFNEKQFKDIESKLHKRGRKVLYIHRKQAMFPENSFVIKNEIGTSSGFKLVKDKCSFYFLPGIPKEFKSLVKNFVFPDILNKLNNLNISTRTTTKTIKTIGLGESEIATKLNDVVFDNVELSYRIYYPEIHLRLISKDEDEKSAKKNIDKYTHLLKNKLGEYVFTVEDESMEEVVSKLLFENNLTIATAESCTGGLLASILTDVPGSSAYFLRGVISYNNASKSELLKLDEELMIKHGAVSSQVVEAMAEGIKNLSGTDIGIAISGIAGPGGGSKEKPVGTVYIGIAYKEEPPCSQKYRFNGRRKDIKLASSKHALDIIRIKVDNDSILKN